MPQGPAPPQGAVKCICYCHIKATKAQPVVAELTLTGPVVIVPDAESIIDRCMVGQRISRKLSPYSEKAQIERVLNHLAEIVLQPHPQARGVEEIALAI